ncbi:MAG: glycosyltransferase family 39 protein [Ectothiorhodospiraceae bacterium]|nr:glycosyltransferase family 39 protein [Ectothiorhodospiraceae bacterium]
MTPRALSLQTLQLILLLAVALSFYLNIYAVPLFDLDEGAFSEATREMFVRGDFISTFLDGQPRYDKPILIYWLQAACVFVFGVNEFAFRLPSALAATLWVLAVFAFVRRVRDERSGLLAAIITATAFEVSVMAKAATADSLLNLLIACALFCIYLYWKERERRWVLLAFTFIGLGFLTKGPVAVLVPLAVSFLFFTFKKEFKLWLKMVFNPTGIVIFLAIAMPWYVVQYLKEGDAFIQGFFFKHNIDRFSNSMEQHGGGIFYYLPILLVAVLPYTTVFIKTLLNAKQLMRDELSLFALIWLVFVVGFFSLSGTKLPHYVLYGLSGMFVVMALSLDKLAEGKLMSKMWLFMPQTVLFVLLLLLPEIIDGLLPGVKDVYIQEMLAEYESHFSLTYRLFFVTAIMFSIWCMGERRFLAGDKLLMSGVVSAFSLSAFLLPVLAGLHQGPVKEAALLAKTYGDDVTVVRWHLNMPSFSVYRQRVTETRRPQRGEVVLTKSKYLPQLEPYEVLYRKGGVVMARLTDLPKVLKKEATNKAPER